MPPGSPPSRGAWIEIGLRRPPKDGHQSRPPRGGRGLKLDNTDIPQHVRDVAPLAGGVD